MTRRSTRPIWPTHRAKRYRPPHKPFAAPWIKPPTTGELAAALVRRGLASRAILDPQRTPRRRAEPDL